MKIKIPIYNSALKKHYIGLVEIPIEDALACETAIKFIASLPVCEKKELSRLKRIRKDYCAFFNNLSSGSKTLGGLLAWCSILFCFWLGAVLPLIIITGGF